MKNPSKHLEGMNAAARLTRRRWLALGAGTGFSFCLPGRMMAQSGETTGDTALAARVVELVMLRETIADDISPFRQGASARIETVMNQYNATQLEFAGMRMPRLTALRWALRGYLDENLRSLYAKAARSESFPGSVSGFSRNTFKCNKLVADAYAFGAGEGLSISKTWEETSGSGTGWPAIREGTALWPPVANALASPEKNIRSLTNARVLRQPGESKASPELGDLICFHTDGGSGHVGLYLGKNLIVTAKETGVEIHPVEYEESQHGGITYIRKYTGTGR